MVLLLLDFESRFNFNTHLPDPPIWEPGPKTYPSKKVEQKKSKCERITDLSCNFYFKISSQNPS